MHNVVVLEVVIYYSVYHLYIKLDMGYHVSAGNMNCYNRLSGDEVEHFLIDKTDPRRNYQCGECGWPINQLCEEEFRLCNNGVPDDETIDLKKIQCRQCLRKCLDSPFIPIPQLFSDASNAERYAEASPISSPNLAVTSARPSSSPVIVGDQSLTNTSTNEIRLPNTVTARTIATTSTEPISSWSDCSVDRDVENGKTVTGLYRAKRRPNSVPVYSQKDTYNLLDKYFGTNDVLDLSISGVSTKIKHHNPGKRGKSTPQVFIFDNEESGHLEKRDLYAYDILGAHMAGKKSGVGFITGSVILLDKGGGEYEDTGMRVMCLLRTLCAKPQIHALIYAAKDNTVQHVKADFVPRWMKNQFCAPQYDWDCSKAVV